MSDSEDSDTQLLDIVEDNLSRALSQPTEPMVFESEDEVESDNQMEEDDIESDDQGDGEVEDGASLLGDTSDFTIDDIRRKYEELMEKGHEKVSKKHREKSLKQNIRAGESLFSQLEISCMEASNSNNSASETIGNSWRILPRDLLLAMQHTQLCSRKLKEHAQAPKAAEFDENDLNQFLKALKRECIGQAGTYSPGILARKVVMAARGSSLHSPKMSLMFGATLEEDQVVRKERKKPVRQEKPDIMNATQGEVVSRTTIEEEGEDDKTTEGIAKSVLRSIKARHKKGETELSVLEAGYASSVAEMTQRLFGVAFLARDGRVNITKEPNALGPLDLTVKPDKPPKDQNDTFNRASARGQTIVSLSSKFIKELHAAVRRGEMGAPPDKKPSKAADRKPVVPRKND